MDVIQGIRVPGEALPLVAALKRLGIGGRDAAYLASIDFEAADAELRKNYRMEFRYMVGVDERAEAARLIGLSDW
jgi:hypothetical protein